MKFKRVEVRKKHPKKTSKLQFVHNLRFNLDFLSIFVKHLLNIKARKKLIYRLKKYATH